MITNHDAGKEVLDDKAETSVAKSKARRRPVLKFMKVYKKYKKLQDFICIKTSTKRSTSSRDSRSI